MSSAVEQFRDETYVSLETYKKSGQGVPTPVWFCIHQGIMYISAPAHTGKVKRIRNNSQVRIAACDARGNLQGPWVEGRARVADAAETQVANRLLKRKYHVQRLLIDLVGKLRGWRTVMFAIEL
jgi:hypothetical protein